MIEFEEIKSKVMCREMGLTKVIEVLTRELGKSYIDALVHNWDIIEEQGKLSIGAYISNFDRAYQKVKADGGKILDT